MTDLTKCPISKEDAFGYLEEEPTGFKAILEEFDKNEPPCNDGCLAPGSSPHWHPKIKFWRLFGANGYTDVDPETLFGVRTGMIHRWD